MLIIILVLLFILMLLFGGATSLHNLCVPVMSHATRIPCLDGLRGIAALAVMLFHFNIFFLPQARLAEIVPFVGRAYLAVDFFFLLSGFVMAHVYGRLLASDRRALPLFAKARFARLYPLFAITTLTMAVVYVLSHEQLVFVSFSGRSLLLQPFLLQQWAPSLSWDYPSWSISTEVEAYVFFAFCAPLLVTGKHPRLIATGCIVTVTVLSVARAGSLNTFLGIPALLRTLAEFSLGVLLYRAHLANAKSSRWWAAAFFILLAGGGLIARQDSFLVVAFACLIFYAARATGPFERLLDSWPLVALGNWSYSIYLWHAPVHFAVMAGFAVLGHPVAYLGLSSARFLLLSTGLAVIVLSALHYRYFEQPIKRLILADRRHSASTAGDVVPIEEAESPAIHLGRTADAAASAHRAAENISDLDPHARARPA
jgi:peptidoglycan/LPS O-acetylase OafA/YrhL